MKNVGRVVIFFICIVVLAGILIGHKVVKNGMPWGVREQVEAESEPDSFKILERGSIKGLSYTIVYHRITKVMYIVSGSGYGGLRCDVLVNPDGSPMVYEEK